MQADSLQNEKNSLSDTVVVNSESPQIFIEEASIDNGKHNYPFTEFMTRDIQPDWILYISLSLLILVAWLRLVYTKFIINIFKSTVNYSTAQKIFSGPGIIQKRISLTLQLIYIISGGLYLYLVFHYFDLFPFDLKGFNLFLAASGFLAGMIIYRYILLLLTGFIFRQENLFSEYLFHHFVTNKVLGIILLPLIIALAYTKGITNDIIFYISFSIVLGMFFLKISRALIFIFKNVVSLFYLILYLCTVEILPIVVILKFVISLA